LPFITTFDTWPSDDNEKHSQDFPSGYTGNRDGLFPPNTGAEKLNTLGFYDPDLEQVVDTIYDFCFELPHTGPTLNITFGASGLETEITSDEAWGLDNVEVYLYED
jgi:hypothetical protein